MGYYQETVSCEVFIPAEKLPELLVTLKALNGPENDHLKRGGSFSGGKTTAKWYSWMNGDWDKTATSVKEIFELLGFEECEEDAEGLKLGRYESKRGQEELFLEAAAPFVAPGSRIDWQGEDGSQWALIFELGKMTRHEGEQLEWDDDLEEYV